MSGYLAARGSPVTRLHLPHDDMRLDSNAGKVLEEIKRQLRLGVDVIVWAALLCTAWSRWQRINAAAGGVTAAALEAARRESRIMLCQLQKVLRKGSGVGSCALNKVHHFSWELHITRVED